MSQPFYHHTDEWVDAVKETVSWRAVFVLIAIAISLGLSGYLSFSKGASQFWHSMGNRSAREYDLREIENGYVPDGKYIRIGKHFKDNSKSVYVRANNVLTDHIEGKLVPVYSEERYLGGYTTSEDNLGSSFKPRRPKKSEAQIYILSGDGTSTWYDQMYGSGGDAMFMEEAEGVLLYRATDLPEEAQRELTRVPNPEMKHIYIMVPGPRPNPLYTIGFLIGGLIFSIGALACVFPIVKYLASQQDERLG